MLSRLRLVFVGLALLTGTLMASPALAQKIAYVDFERAVEQSTEARQAQQRLQQMYATKLAELKKQRDELQKAAADYEQRKLLMSDEARVAEETKLVQQQQTLQQNMMMYQQEMDQKVAEALQELDAKLRSVSGAVAQERGYALVIDKAIVVYSGPDIVDMTDAVIQRYNAGK